MSWLYFPIQILFNFPIHLTNFLIAFLQRRSQHPKINYYPTKNKQSTAFRLAAHRARPMATQMVARNTQRRGAQTVPRMGTEEQMKAEALEQIKARLAYQKELMKTQDPAHHLQEEITEMYKWVKVTFSIGLPICLLSVVYSFVMEEHAHKPDGELPEFIAIRKKEFPWECGDCDLFDGACWKKCRAEKAGK